MLCSAISASADSPFALGVRTNWLGTRVFTGLDIGWFRTPEERMRGRAIEEKYIMEIIRDVATRKDLRTVSRTGSTEDQGVKDSVSPDRRLSSGPATQRCMMNQQHGRAGGGRRATVAGAVASCGGGGENNQYPGAS